MSSPRVPSPRVAPRTKRPPLVPQRDCHPVQLGLDGVRDRRVLRGQPQTPPHSPVEFAEILLGVRIVEAQHGGGVDHRLESGKRFPPHALGRGIRGHDSGMLGLEASQLGEKPIVLPVRKDRLGQDVICVIVPADLLAERAGALFGRAVAHDVLMVGGSNEGGSLYTAPGSPGQNTASSRR
jgi:hypothetical protein